MNVAWAAAVRRDLDLMVFRVLDDNIAALRILHGAQQWPPQEP